MNELIRDGSSIKKDVMQFETIVIIENANRKSLMKLFNAFDLNPLLMYDMSITQFISKVVTYTHHKFNLDRHRYRDGEEAYIGELSDSDDSKIRRNQ